MRQTKVAVLTAAGIGSMATVAQGDDFLHDPERRYSPYYDDDDDDHLDVTAGTITIRSDDPVYRGPSKTQQRTAEAYEEARRASADIVQGPETRQQRRARERAERKRLPRL